MEIPDLRQMQAVKEAQFRMQVDQFFNQILASVYSQIVGTMPTHTAFEEAREYAKYAAERHFPGVKFQFSDEGKHDADFGSRSGRIDSDK